MNRRDFINSSCAACLPGLGLIMGLSGCASTRYTSGQLNNDGLLVPVSEFTITQKNQPQYRNYIIVRNDGLQYPICLYRFSSTEYSALWMRCTHQGTELQVAGDALQCPAHGSEFNNRGKINSGPADSDLRSFPVTIINDQLFIDLRKP